MNEHQELTFGVLEDVLFQPLSEQSKLLAKVSIQSVGPLIELVLANPPYAIDFLKQRSTPETKSLLRVMESSPLQYRQGFISSAPHEVEFFRAPQTEQEFGREEWIAFERRLEMAARKASLPNIFAKELTGTCVEMVDNLFIHSNRPDSGIVGYRWNAREFEYVVADCGVGILHSLREHPDYAHLIDAEQALQIALTDGESRFGRSVQRGNGFNTLIRNIASRRSCLRFRSDDRAHVIDGLGTKLTKGSFTCTAYQGFLISVRCLVDSL